jgi:hypothetical protein
MFTAESTPRKIFNTDNKKPIFFGGPETYVPYAGGYFVKHSNSNLDTIIYAQTFGSYSMSQTYFRDAMRTDSGMYVVANESNIRFNNNSTYITKGPGANWYDACLSKLDTNGNTIWNRCYGYYKTQDAARSVHQAPDGNYLVVGTGTPPEDTTLNANNYGLKVFKITPAGNLIWEYYLGTKGSHEAGISSVMTSNGDLIIAGYSNAGTTIRSAPIYGNQDAWLLRLRTFSEKLPVSPITTHNVNETPLAIKKTGETTYQITTTKPTTLTLTDALGRQLRTIKMDANTTTIDLNNYAQGVYFIAANGYKSVKIVR